jgi:hypothetical protein
MNRRAATAINLLIALRRKEGRKALVTFLNSFQGINPAVVGFEVLTVGLLKLKVCWYMTVCRQVCGLTHPVIRTKILASPAILEAYSRLSYAC